jgi:hypothetical protein
MNQAFNDFLSSIGGGLSGDGGPNLKNYQHATKLYVEGGYARAPKFNHLYFVSFNINDGVVRDRSWLQNSYNTVGLLVKSTTLPKFKITNEAMNQYNRKTQVQTKLTYEPVTMEFHDDNSEITNGLWKNYYRYYYTDSIYGGKDDTVKTSPSRVSLGKKLFGGLLSPGRKRIKQRENNTFPDAYTDNKYKEITYPYGLDNFQSVPFFKSIDIFVLYQQKFTQITLINPKITSWDHDDVGQSDSTKLMRNKMSLIYENVLYNDGRIGKGSRSGVFAEAFYDTSPSPLSIAGKGSASLFGPGGLIGGVEDIFGENGALAQGDYLAAALQAATLIKNAGQISEQQLSAEGYSMLGAAVGIAVSSRNGEIGQNLENYFGNGIGVYTNQYSKNNLEEIPAAPVEFDTYKYIEVQRATAARAAAEYAQEVANEAARTAQQQEELAQRTNAELAALTEQKNTIGTQISDNLIIAEKANKTINEWESKITNPTDTNSLYASPAYAAAIAAGDSDSVALGKAYTRAVADNQGAQTIIESANREKESVYALTKLLIANQESLTQQAQLIKDYGPDYAAKISRESLAYIQEYGVDLVKENTLDTGAETNPFLNHQIATNTYLAALNSGKISSVSQAAADLKSTEDRVKVEQQAAINQAIGGITTNYSNLLRDRDEETTSLDVLSQDQRNLAEARATITEHYQAWQIDQSTAAIAAAAKELGLYDKLSVEKLIIDRTASVRESENAIAEKFNLVKEYNARVGNYPATIAAQTFYLELIKRYDPTNPDAGLTTKQDFIDKYSGKSYIDPVDGNTYKYKEDGAVLKYYAALEAAPALYTQVIANLDQTVRNSREKVLINTIALDDVKSQIDAAYIAALESSSATSKVNRDLADSIATKIVESGKTQAKITASELLLKRMVIVDTQLGSGQAVLEKELSYNPNPNKPYVIMIDGRTAAEILADSQLDTVGTEKFVSASAKSTVSAKAAEIAAIDKIRAKLGVSVVSVFNVSTVETVDANGNKIYNVELTSRTFANPPDLVTTVIITYKNEFGAIVKDPIYFRGDEYISQSEATAKILATYKSVKGIKVLGIVASTRRDNTAANGVRLNTHNS